MWKRIALLTLFLGTCAVGVLVFGRHSTTTEGPLNLTATSPDNTYTLRLQEQGDIPLTPPNGHGDHQVRFSVIKGGTAVVENETLYAGDVYDERFSELFPKWEWVTNAAIRFGQKSAGPPTQHDAVIIANDTDEVVTYLNVRVGKDEMFLLFELPPKSTTELSVQPQTGQKADLSWVWCRGRLGSGANLPEAGTNFNIRGKYSGPAQYCIEIKDGGASIGSREFEGYKSGASGKDVVVPRVSNCPR